MGNEEEGGKEVNTGAVLLFIGIASTARGADFTLERPGTGPISVHTEFTYEGRGERLIATATNDSSLPISYVKLCVRSEMKGCLFTIWNTEPWQPGKQLQWNLTSSRHMQDLGHEVTFLPEAEPKKPAQPPKPVPAPRPMPPPPETARVIWQQIGSSAAGAIAMPVGMATIAAPIYHINNTVIVETTNERMTWYELARRGSLVLAVNGTVEFQREGNAFIVLDSHGNKHKFGMIHLELLNAGPPAPAK